MGKKIEGVFLFEKVSKIGTGHTEKKVTHSMYCLANEIDDDLVEVRYLGPNDEPLGDVETIPKQEFIHNYTFQPYYLERKKSETVSRVNKHCAIAEEHARNKEFHSAEFEFMNALKLDEENLRANFGIGNVYLDLGETEKAKDIFIKLSHVEAIFEEANKHFFNECAIQLRKQKLFDESIDYYEKAISLSPRDENLCFNLARVYYDKSDQAKADEQMAKALELNPDFKEAKAFIEYMQKKNRE